MNRSAPDVVAHVQDATRTYASSEARVRALDGVTLEVRRGEMIALMGPSGCGKSTLLNLLSGVDRADAGRVDVCGIDLARATESAIVELRRHSIGIVFQAFHLVPHLDVRENVSLPLALAGRDEPERVNDLLERVGLSARARHFPAQLSGGEQQRTAVARALVHRPALVLADEPTGNLDSENGAAVMALLDEMRRAEGSALVVATHDRGVAGRADRILRLRDGRIEPS